MNRDSKVGMGCLILFFLPFAGFGTFAAVMAVRAALSGEWGQAGLLSIFALVFGGVGFGYIVVVLRGRVRVSEIDRLKAENPDQRWMWRPEWVNGRIESSTRLRMRQAAAFAALWNLISLPGAVFAMREFVSTRESPLLLALIFPVVGVGLLSWAVRLAIRYHKYGTSVFELAHVPGVIGRGVGGLVRTSVPLRPAEGFRVALHCVRQYTTGSGDSRSTSEKMLWQEERTVTEFEQDWGGQGVMLAVAFRLPRDVLESDDRDTDNQVIWRLRVDAAVPGVDYHVQFEVPVFRTEESDKPFPPEVEEEMVRSALKEVYRPPPDSPIRVSKQPRGTEIVFPAGRNPLPALGLTGFTAILTAATWFTMKLNAPLLLPIVFGLVNLLLFYAVATMWLGHSRIVVGPNTTRVTKGILFFTSTHSFPTDSLAKVSVTTGMQAGNTLYYDLVVPTIDGKKIKVGTSIKDKREAEWLAGVLREGATRERL